MIPGCAYCSRGCPRAQGFAAKPSPIGAFGNLQRPEMVEAPQWQSVAAAPFGRSIVYEFERQGLGFVADQQIWQYPCIRADRRPARR